MAVAGFKMDDLNVVLQDGELTVSGHIRDKDAEDGVQVLHRGIAARAFKKTFRLADYIKVTSAEMKDGLLTVSLMREIPEEKKPRMISIQIGGTNDKAAIEHKKANN